VLYVNPVIFVAKTETTEQCESASLRESPSDLVQV